MEDTKVQWHLGFASAIDLELAKNRSDLTYHREYNLNKQALEVDLLVIKKDKDTLIDNEIGKMFRKYNIMEYKSPDDHFSIDTFYKAGAYASLYKSYGTTVDERKADEITVSIVREVEPVKLFQYFEEHEIHYTNPYSGIYYVTDRVLFPTQIIVTKKLNIDGHMWLTALSAGLKKQQLRKLLEKIESFDSKLDRELADSVLEVAVKANRQIVEELRGEDHMCQALLEIMEPEINKIKETVKEEVTEEVTREVTRTVTREVTRAVTKEVTREVTKEVTKRERQKGIKALVTFLRDSGQNDVEIKKAIEKVYEVSVTEAEEYL
ncbi:MAG: hypothetical protein K2N90_01770 [Lachnospiraceae bacterium]|nr:hypothetical protein [Lachnospiraceae bacterium]